MPALEQAHSRSHGLLLLQKTLNLKDSTASLFTLVLDTLEQPATVLLREFALRAKANGAKTILVSFDTFRKPAEIDIVIQTVGDNLEALRRDIVAHIGPPKSKESKRTLVLFDTINPLTLRHADLMPAFLSSLINPAASLVVVYHTDIPDGSTALSASYAPSPLTMLSHLATAVLNTANLSHEIARQRARNRSAAEPHFGLAEGKAGVLIGLSSPVTATTMATAATTTTQPGYVVHMDLRRQSGRSVRQSFALFPGAAANRVFAAAMALDEHPEFRVATDADHSGSEGGHDASVPQSTFNLGLTEKQKRDREGVVLPYFDAQVDIGGGEGGRILYDMGREDDFDDEEDEI